ncbi:MAG: alpha-mannosidase, partial [Cyanobacteria bacterium K_DeepCast_35m_m2_023]|nr:alpha-mannosidase [Cyanobacteria bacterium K_DeepCast_35m_m2_023]
PDWRVLLFQQFHDILPGTSVPEVFEQAEPQWRQARRQARRQRDLALSHWLAGHPAAREADPQAWTVVQLQPLPAQRRCLRLPAGAWRLADGTPLPSQPAAGGGQWLQLPALAGVAALSLDRAAPPPSGPSLEPVPQHPLQAHALADGRWRLGNGLVSVAVGPGGLEQLWDGAGRAYLGAPAQLRRYRDAGEFWDAWDLAADYADQPLPIDWHGGVQWIEQGPLCLHLTWRGRCGRSDLRLDLRVLADTPWVELVLRIDWRQQHELLRVDLPLAQPAQRWAADTSGGVSERPAAALTAREQARWEVPAISWLAAEAAAPGGGLGVLLDGPQGVSATPDRLGLSLLRGPTWPDPSADNGSQRQRWALMPCPQGWRAAALPQQAVRLREPLWRRPLAMARDAMPGLPALGSDLQLLTLEPCTAEQGPNDGALISVQNLSPLRRRLDLGGEWTVLARCDGLGEPLPGDPDDVQLAPWACGCWRIRRRRQSS